MRSAALSLLLAAPSAAAAPFGNPAIGGQAYGVLLLATDGGGAWKTELGAIRAQLQGVAVESVEFSGDGLSVQRALDRLRGQHVAKVVAVPMEPVSEAASMDQIRYLFGIREEPSQDRPERAGSSLPALKPDAKRVMVLPPSRASKRLKSDVALVLTATIDKSPVLADILAERAQAQARRPQNEAVVLVGLAPRSDKSLPAWKAAAGAIAESVRVKGGFREAGVIWVRDGVRAGQQDKDREEAKALLRRLTTQGSVVAVPLAADGRRVGRLLQREIGSGGYRWNGKGLIGDKRFADWIRATSIAASKFPDVRRYRDDASRAAGGFR
ncbi:MAG: hypothetical protein HYZ74_03235 [Elusimicrobia bacterium]|nr:hypothetical protein [Elusimicrobiota bacterium]